MEFFINNIYTIFLLPLWVFLLLLFGKFFNIVHSRKTITALTLLSTLIGIIFSVGAFVFIHNTPDFVYEASYNFIKIQDYALNLGVYVDNLSVMMLLVVTTVSFVVQLYSYDYMYHDKSFPRFFSYLNLFNFSMLGLVLSHNLFQTYVFWELVGVSSYLLIGFWYKKPSASAASKKAFIMNRIGDFGFLLGLIAVSYIMYQNASVITLATVPYLNINDIANYLYSFTTDYTFVLICIALFLGSVAKSAQFPLHTWLADAMEGPTPVSALIHSATMVAAGVYLVARLYPIFSLSDIVMNIIAITGLITALICAFFAITQNDFKRILAYSTNSQLGLMFLALGAGAYSGALFHLVAHAYIKSMLFLCSGVVIHSLFDQQDVRFMGGLRKKLPSVAVAYFIGCISLSGVLFSGFFSKEMILSSLFESNHFVYGILFFIISLMTAFYMFRSYFLVFEGEFRGAKEPHKITPIFDYSLFILVLVVLFLGIIINDHIANYLMAANEVVQSHISHLLIANVSVGVALVGILLSFIFYNWKFKPLKVPILYQLSYNRFYIDNLYRFIAEKVYYFVSRLCSVFDKYIIDGIVLFSSWTVRATSWLLSRFQTGNFQSYIAYTTMFLAVVFFGLMLAYTLILNFNLAGGY